MTHNPQTPPEKNIHAISSLIESAQRHLREVLARPRIDSKLPLARFWLEYYAGKATEAQLFNQKAKITKDLDQMRETAQAFLDFEEKRRQMEAKVRCEEDKERDFPPVQSEKTALAVRVANRALLETSTRFFVKGDPEKTSLASKRYDYDCAKDNEEMIASLSEYATCIGEKDLGESLQMHSEDLRSETDKCREEYTTLLAESPVQSTTYDADYIQFEDEYIPPPDKITW